MTEPCPNRARNVPRTACAASPMQTLVCRSRSLWLRRPDARPMSTSPDGWTRSRRRSPPWRARSAPRARVHVAYDQHRPSHEISVHFGPMRLEAAHASTFRAWREVAGRQHRTGTERATGNASWCCCNSILDIRCARSRRLWASSLIGTIRRMSSRGRCFGTAAWGQLPRPGRDAQRAGHAGDVISAEPSPSAVRRPVRQAHRQGSERFLAEMLGSSVRGRPPRVINTDENAALAAALAELNNSIEGDHGRLERNGRAVEKRLRFARRGDYRQRYGTVSYGVMWWTARAVRGRG